MDPKEIELLQQAVETAQNQAVAEKKLREQAEETAGKLEEQLAALKIELEKNQALVQAEQIKADGLKTELEKATEATAAITAELETTKAKLGEFEAVEAARQQELAWQTRVAQLPEGYQQALEKKSEEEQAQFKKHWIAADDASWTSFVEGIKVAFAGVRISYLQRSTGKPLPGTTSTNDIRSEVAAMLGK